MNKRSPSIFDPPGTLLMWGVVLLELVMFVALVFVVMMNRNQSPEEFKAASSHLALSEGLLYTGVLLTSGFFAAEGVRLFYELKIKLSRLSFSLAALSGVLFLVLKWQDLRSKLQKGFHIETNDFWQSYWLSMSFHFLHVLVGVLILTGTIISLFGQGPKDPEFSVRGSTLFWHMCDIAWLMLFAAFYLGTPSI